MRSNGWNRCRPGLWAPSSTASTSIAIRITTDPTIAGNTAPITRSAPLRDGAVLVRTHANHQGDSMNIPILRLSIPEESQAWISRSVQEVLQSGSLTGGRFTQQFEDLFAEFCGAKHAVACSSGTSALE